MPASQVGMVVALSWVTAAYALAVNNSASAASALGCSFPKYDNETGKRQWDCNAVWGSGQLAECYDDLSYVYGVLATRFAARVTTFVVTADKFGVYQRLADGTVVLAMNAINSAFLDNCDDDASINACREMLHQCDKEGDAEVFDIAKAGAKKMCEYLQFTGVASLAKALTKVTKVNKVAGLGPLFDGLEAFDGDCEDGGALVAVAEQMSSDDRSKGSGNNVWDVLTRFGNSVPIQSAGSPGVVASIYYGVIYSIQAYLLRERTCRLYRGLVDSKRIVPEEAGRCLQEDKFDKFDSFAMINAMDGNDLGNAYYGIHEYVDSRPPLIKPEYVPYQAPEMTEAEKAAKKEKDEKAAKKKEEFEMLHSRTCKDDFHLKDELLLGCLNGLGKLFLVLAIEKGADSAVSFKTGDNGWVDVVQAVAGFMGVRHIVQFLKTSFIGHAFDLKKCLKRIDDCGKGHEEAAVKSIHALLQDIQLGPTEALRQGRPLPLVGKICEPFGEGGKRDVYLAKVLRLARCAKRTHRKDVTERQCVEDLTGLLGPIWESGDDESSGPLKSIRELLAVEGKDSENEVKPEDSENEVKQEKSGNEVNDKLVDVIDGFSHVYEKMGETTKLKSVVKPLESALKPLVDAVEPSVALTIGIVAAFLHRKFSHGIDRLAAHHSLGVDAEELFKDDLEFATMSMWGM